MLSKSQISFIKSLHQKKYRKEHGLFIVEGIKSIKEFFQSSYQIHTIFYNSEQYNLLPKLPANINLFEVKNAELDKISTLQTPQGFLALIHIPKNKELALKELKNQFTLVLDGVQDPGNMGTIIRTADWFGFKNIICSADCVEVFNPKTVQATMGSLARVNIYETDLPALLEKNTIPVFGALLDGESIYKTQWGAEGLVILGNEGKGISAEVIKKINKPVTIPRIGEAESLNVAVSAAIFCAELVRVRN
ncbi:RNA methyltransferase [Pedobacter riviphilus]|uniref:RNA methyltransferase n=1 Tax=Pedobacter riviphilus TaxID=2766984 RepID=A0ABX6TBY4_9SPHI|nr:MULTISPECIES: RNA methyltransferase [Pedobacter]NII83845.1 TrmH family RNA methyltransferase [Pedobacter sp. SG908]NMN37695.1 TrmH family RNA methyltransferase [Pedobacter sp. SG918]QNR82994.1 RNA methyltransferase [Pedobacter riviphilus]